MNLKILVPITVATAATLAAVPAEAFTLSGNPTYTPNGLPTELSVTNETIVSDGDINFSVSDPTALDIGSIFLEGSLGVFGVTGSASYAAVSSYITGFQFFGEEAIFNLDAGESVLAGFINDSNITTDSRLSGTIVDLAGNRLGTAVGSFSSVQTAGQTGNYSINLEGTPIPTPALLPGLIGLAVGVLRKRHSQADKEM